MFLANGLTIMNIGEYYQQVVKGLVLILAVAFDVLANKAKSKESKRSIGGKLMKTILCYGDSNTYGLKSDLVSRYPRNVRWTGILQEKLGSEYYVIEEGLGGRTTVWDDPVEDYKNGKKYLLPCLDSHKPLDLVIIMLGTNDLKSRFSVTPFDIGASMENLVKTIIKSDAGVEFSAAEKFCW